MICYYNLMDYLIICLSIGLFGIYWDFAIRILYDFVYNDMIYDKET